MFESIEDILALPTRVSELDQLRRSVLNGNRPTFTNTSKCLKSVLARLWPTNPEKRPIFSIIARNLEKQRFWVAGMDSVRSAEYKEWLDRDGERCQKGGFDPSWLTAFDQEVVVDVKALNLTEGVETVNVSEPVMLMRDGPNAVYLRLLDRRFRQGTPLMLFLSKNRVSSIA
jgi:hypothetical protein